MGIMFFGKTRFKDLGVALEKLKKKQAKMTVFLFMVSSLTVMAQEEGTVDEHAHSNMPTPEQIDSLLHAITPSKAHAAKFAELVIQDAGGRMKPINTFSSELLRKLSLKDKYTDFNSDQVFLSMMLNPAAWYNAEFIALDKQGQNDSLRKIIGVEHGRKYVKATDFFDSRGQYKLTPYLKDAYATNTPDQFQKDFKSVDERLVLLNRALGGEIVKIFPLLNDETINGYPRWNSVEGNIRYMIPYMPILLRMPCRSI